MFGVVLTDEVAWAQDGDGQTGSLDRLRSGEDFAKVEGDVGHPGGSSLPIGSGRILTRVCSKTTTHPVSRAFSIDPRFARSKLNCR